LRDRCVPIRQSRAICRDKVLSSRHSSADLRARIEQPKSANGAGKGVSSVTP
jgi:hypothetical protein